MLKNLRYDGVRKTANYLLALQCVLKNGKYFSVRYWSEKTDFMIERGRAEENIYFLKKQTEQLRDLREKILKKNQMLDNTLDKVTDGINQLCQPAHRSEPQADMQPPNRDETKK